MIDRTSQNKNI